jgi:hypothetical protein
MGADVADVDVGSEVGLLTDQPLNRLRLEYRCRPGGAVTAPTTWPSRLATVELTELNAGS